MIILTSVLSAVVFSPLRIEPNNQVQEVSGIAEFIISKSDNKPFNFAFLSKGNSDHAYRYFFKLWHKDAVAIETPINDPQRKTVTNQLLVLCDYKCSPLGDPLWEVAGFGPAKIVGVWDVYLGKIYKLVHK